MEAAERVLRCQNFDDQAFKKCKHRECIPASKGLAERNSGEIQDLLRILMVLDIAEAMDLQDCKELMVDYMDLLKDREKLILTMRYGLNGQRVRTLEESQVINLTRERVRQIQIAAVQKIRRVMKLRYHFFTRYSQET